ncbi:MAG: molybdopterin molybdotransferase MoeA [Bacteroidia bacterium]|nr:molybdopterin molybdotransferase MoeA [Bacteroidia bacterium]MCZ2249572.1 molybdopterin molybdotransferase MoeA [Bacteroidia bacterium]
MVTVQEAFQQINNAVSILSVVEIDLCKANGFVLAQDYYSPISFPPFGQSAMDGYALPNNPNQTTFKLKAELKAGDASGDYKLENDEACRVYTGSMLPVNTYCVIKQEDVERIEDKIYVKKSFSKNENVRPLGEQIMKDELAVQQGTLLNPGTIGFLATIGIGSVKVYRKPRIVVLTTGNELVKVGNDLSEGKIYESNSFTLMAALESYGFQAHHIGVKDDYETTRQTIENALINHDLILITGGISVGDYDFVGKALYELQVKEYFYKVKQKPGKPLFFGKKENTIIFGLPGNPASVLTSFYLYVLKALQLMTGRKEDFLKRASLYLNQEYSKSINLTHFLKGKASHDIVHILPFQSSAMLSPFIEANCIIKLDEGKSDWLKNDKVEVFLLN